MQQYSVDSFGNYVLWTVLGRNRPTVFVKPVVVCISNDQVFCKTEVVNVYYQERRTPYVPVLDEDTICR